MANLISVLKLLEQERGRLTSQLEKVTRALAALRVSGGKTYTKHSLSAAAISRIRAAQKARWARWRKAQKEGR